MLGISIVGALRAIRVEGPGMSSPSKACSVVEFRTMFPLLYLVVECLPIDRPGEESRLSDGTRSAEVALS